MSIESTNSNGNQQPENFLDKIEETITEKNLYEDEIQGLLNKLIDLIKSQIRKEMSDKNNKSQITEESNEENWNLKTSTGIEKLKFENENILGKIKELNDELNLKKKEIKDNLGNCCEKICSELNELKISLTERLSRLDKKQDEKSLLDDFMSQNDRCDRQSMFETIFEEIKDLKNSIKINESTSKIPPSIKKKSIALRLDSVIPIYDESLLQNLDPEAFEPHHSPEWFCFAFFDLLKKKILNPGAINEVMEILIKIIRVCDEKNLDFIEKILNEVDNYNLVAKYETVRQVMMRDPNRKRRMLNIFIEDLEKLVKSTTTDELDQNFQQNNPELYQKIKIILEMANCSILDIIGIDTINTLKRRWCVLNPIPVLRKSSFMSK